MSWSCVYWTTRTDLYEKCLLTHRTNSRLAPRCGCDAPRQRRVPRWRTRMPQIQTRTPDFLNSSPWLRDTAPHVHESRGAAFDEAPPFQWLSTAAAFADTGGLVSGDELAELIRLQCDAAV